MTTEKRESKCDFIEELVFAVEPEWLDRYVEAEADILAGPLARQKGFAGWQIEIDEGNPIEVRSIYYWVREDDYRNLDQAWLHELKVRIEETIPADKVRFIAARHATARRWRIRQLAPTAGTSEMTSETTYELDL